MYCMNCGKQLPKDAKFCSNCGARQGGTQTQKKSSSEKKRGHAWIMLAIAVAIFVGAVILEENDDKAIVTRDEIESKKPQQTIAARQIPQNGWYEENGKTYYYKDGIKLTGMQEIDYAVYYFYEDGMLAVNTEVNVDGNVIETGYDGRVEGFTIANVSGDWSSEKYHFGNNGTSSIFELEMEMENCDRMGLYLEANGMYGASVSCNWKVYVRSHGSWVFAKEFYYTEPSQSVEIRFDTPIDFDAITAYPTVQGNASYSAGYAVYDVHIVM